MRLKKRAQLAMFIVFGIILVVAIGLLFFFTNRTQTSSRLAGSDDLTSFVEHCLESTAEDGLELIGRQGGYYKFSGESYIEYSGDDGQPGPLRTDFNDINVPLYLVDGNEMPSKDKIRGQLSLYINENIGNCINGFSDYKDRGFSVDEGLPISETLIEEDWVRLHLSYPVTLEKGESIERFEKFSSDLPMRIGRLYDLTEEFMAAQVLDPFNICMTCLIEYKNNGFYPQLLILEDRVVMFVIADTERQLNGEYYDFVFANKY